MIWMIATYSLLLALAFILVMLVKSSEKMSAPIPGHAVTFIVPFKNEAKRIQTLIQSFNQSNWQSNFEVIFVDDHSTDRTIDVLLADLDIPFKILKLKETAGKKAAIVYGVDNAKHEQIHTLDADTSFPPQFLDQISELPLSDLTILPVDLSGKSLFQNLNTIEFQWLQTFTFALAKLKHPTLCNGANLSFSKTAFLNALPRRADFNEPSGDDVFLLQAINRNEGTIAFDSHNKLAISTPAPATFKSLISQRKRWIKKVLNLPALIAIVCYAIYHVLPILALFNCSTSLLWALPLLLKILAEWLLSRDYAVRQMGVVILHQVYYPVYGVLLVGSLLTRVSWREGDAVPSSLKFRRTC